MHNSCHYWPVRHREDGGGIPSQPDWSKAGRCHQDVFKDLRSEFFSSILNRKLHFKFLAHVEAKNPNAPFDSDEIFSLH